MWGTPGNRGEASGQELLIQFTSHIPDLFRHKLNNLVQILLQSSCVIFFQGSPR
jgi:hypothetical protein